MACFHKVRILPVLSFPSHELPPAPIILHPTALTGEVQETTVCLTSYLLNLLKESQTKKNAAQATLEVMLLSQRQKSHGGGCHATKAQPALATNGSGHG